MKNAPASTLNPAESLMLDIHCLRRRLEITVRDLESVSSAAADGVGEALPGLTAGLRVQIAQLEYFANLSPETIPDEWLLFIDAIELQATWLGDRAQRMRPLSPQLAETLNAMAWDFTALMAPTVAARLWLNDRKNSEARMFQSAADSGVATFCQTAA